MAGDDCLRGGKLIYLDYAATTPVDPVVLRAMSTCLAASPTGPALWANAASTHAAGRQARAAVESARAQVAALIGAASDEIIFTSGATEANNLALKGAVEFNRRGRERVHIVTSRVEHRCVVDSCRWLERQGAAVTWLVPGSDGRVTPAQVLAALRPDTLLVSLMWVNNETGAVNDIPSLAPQLRERGVLLHVDAVQAVGKLSIDLRRVPIDLLSLSAHKLYGPQGIGALFVRRHPRVRVAPQLHGGGHEQGMRSGTLANHQIVGLGAACELAAGRLTVDARRLVDLRERLRAQLSALPGVLRNGPDPAVADARAPHILNLSFAGVDGEALRARLPRLAVSSGSACSSATAEPSYVLRALGRSDALADASLRFSLGRSTTEADVDDAAGEVIAAVQFLRHLSPCEPMGQEAGDEVHAVVPPPDPFTYPPRVWRRFWSATGAGAFAEEPDSVSVRVRDPAGHGVLELSARPRGSGSEALRFRALGGPCVVAVGTWLAEQGNTRNFAEFARIGALEIAAALGLTEERLPAALLGEDAVRSLCDAVRGRAGQATRRGQLA